MFIVIGLLQFAAIVFCLEEFWPTNPINILKAYFTLREQLWISLVS